MKLWKMSIKTGGPKGNEALRWCRESGFVGVGWSAVYDGLAELPADPLPLLVANHRRAVSPVRMVAHAMQPGHFVWLHHQGQFFVCKILEGAVVLGPQIGSEYLAYDVGHARRAEWVQVPENLVPGKIQRAVISRRMVCRIPSTPRLVAYCSFLHTRLKENASWYPTIDADAVRRGLQSLVAEEVEDFVSPDDWEDIVAAYLQVSGWILVKSSCFRSKPRFEFRMIREEAGRTRTAYLQVKSGRVSLPPAHYARDASAEADVYLFSTHPTDPYPGPAAAGVTPIPMGTIRTWMLEHIGLLPQGLRAQLCFAPPVDVRGAVARTPETGAGDPPLAIGD